MTETATETGKKIWKKLGVAAGVLVGLLVALVLGGYLISPEIDLETHARLDASPEAIYAHLDEVEGLRSWWARAAEEFAEQGMPAMIVEHLDGPARGEGMEVGFSSEGKQFESWVLVESQPPSKVVYDIDFQGFVVRRTLTLTAEADGSTLVTWVETGRIDNPLMRYMKLLPQEHVIDNFNGALRALGAVARDE